MTNDSVSYDVPLVRVQLVRESANVRVTEDKVSNPKVIAKILQERFAYSDREQMIVIHLDAGTRILSINVAHTGALDCCTVTAREIFKAAILSNACSIIIAHNHPSGNTTPSSADIAITRTLTDAGRLLDIPVLDHIIITTDDFLSLKESGAWLR